MSPRKESTLPDAVHRGLRHRHPHADRPTRIGALVSGVHHRLDAQPLAEVGEVAGAGLATHPRQYPLGQLDERRKARIALHPAHEP